MKRLTHILSAFGLIALSACTSIDCPLDSVVVWTLSFYDSETLERMKLPYTLTVDAQGAGTLYNKGRGIESMKLPMSHNAQADTLYLRWTEASPEAEEAAHEVTDVLIIKHDNFPHFEAIDCPAAVFHTITDTHFEGHAPSSFPLNVDSLRVIRSQVDYNDVENIRLYLHNNP